MDIITIRITIFIYFAPRRADHAIGVSDVSIIIMSHRCL